MIWAAICRHRGCGWEAVTESERDAMRCMWVHERLQPGHPVTVVFRGVDIDPGDGRLGRAHAILDGARRR